MTDPTFPSPEEGEKPPGPRPRKWPWRVAVLANIKDESKPRPPGVPPDAYADYDHIETIQAIQAAIESEGHETRFILAIVSCLSLCGSITPISVSTLPKV